MSKKNSDFAAAYSRYYPLVYASLYSKTGNMNDTEDMCQNIFARLYEKFDSVESAGGWLYGAARYEFLSYYRKKGAASIVAEDDIPDEQYGSSEIRMLLKETVAAVCGEDEDSRLLFELVAVHKFTYNETGRHLGLSKRKVRYKYGKIVDAIQSYLAGRGVRSLEDLL